MSYQKGVKQAAQDLGVYQGLAKQNLFNKFEGLFAPKLPERDPDLTAKAQLAITAERDYLKKRYNVTPHLTGSLPLNLGIPNDVDIDFFMRMESAKKFQEMAKRLANNSRYTPSQYNKPGAGFHVFQRDASGPEDFPVDVAVGYGDPAKKFHSSIREKARSAAQLPEELKNQLIAKKNVLKHTPFDAFNQARYRAWKRKLDEALTGMPVKDLRLTRKPVAELSKKTAYKAHQSRPVKELEEKTAGKWESFLRTAPIEELRPAVEDFIGSALPNHFKNSDLNKVLHRLRSPESASLNRESLLKVLRWRSSAGMASFIGENLKKRPPNIPFARSIKERAASPLIDIQHGGSAPELASILKYGPNSAIPPVSGAAGQAENVGLFFHRPADNLASRVPAYAQRRSEFAGGDPAVLHAQIPEGLLQEAGRIGGGEHVVPASLWKYIQNPKITKIGRVINLQDPEDLAKFKRFLTYKDVVGHRTHSIDSVLETGGAMSALEALRKGKLKSFEAGRSVSSRKDVAYKDLTPRELGHLEHNILRDKPDPTAFNDVAQSSKLDPEAVKANFIKQRYTKIRSFAKTLQDPDAFRRKFLTVPKLGPQIFVTKGGIIDSPEYGDSAFLARSRKAESSPYLNLVTKEHIVTEKRPFEPRRLGIGSGYVIAPQSKIEEYNDKYPEFKFIAKESIPKDLKDDVYVPTHSVFEIPRRWVPQALRGKLTASKIR